LINKYNQRFQLTIHKLRRVEESEIEFSDYLPKTSKDIDELWGTLSDFVSAFKDPHLKALVVAFMDDPEIAAAYRCAPAAKTLHHAYIGGLLDHVVSLFRSCDLMCRNYPQINRDLLMTGAFLHDIGKMAIPDAILRKPGALTAEETEIMREHCFRGYHMLKKIPFLSRAAEIVYSHQEKYDGTGYPRGLRGEEIPMGARIFSIADTLDAITSDRPYRAAQTISAAREEIVRWSGRQFDPEVVRHFMEMPDTIWEDLRKEINSQKFNYAIKLPPVVAKVT
jgi:putative nucleotidyltransferase with HDIG domain